jgi:hypothetical protein
MTGLISDFLDRIVVESGIHVPQAPVALLPSSASVLDH